MCTVCCRLCVVCSSISREFVVSASRNRQSEDAWLTKINAWLMRYTHILVLERIVFGFFEEVREVRCSVFRCRPPNLRFGKFKVRFKVRPKFPNFWLLLSSTPRASLYNIYVICYRHNITWTLASLVSSTQTFGPRCMYNRTWILPSLASSPRPFGYGVRS